MMQINRNMIIPPVGVKEQLVQTAVQHGHEKTDFRSLMDSVSQSKELQFSKHANMRLQDRNIRFDQAQMQRIVDGVARAQGKGIRDSLVLVDNVALVVNITNKVVVTALSQQDQVFTNIDGAVIV